MSIGYSPTSPQYSTPSPPFSEPEESQIDEDDILDDANILSAQERSIPYAPRSPRLSLLSARRSPPFPLVSEPNQSQFDADDTVNRTPAPYDIEDSSKNMLEYFNLLYQELVEKIANQQTDMRFLISFLEEIREDAALVDIESDPSKAGRLHDDSHLSRAFRIFLRRMDDRAEMLSLDSKLAKLKARTADDCVDDAWKRATSKKANVAENRNVRDGDTDEPDHVDSDNDDLTQHILDIYANLPTSAKAGKELPAPLSSDSFLEMFPKFGTVVCDTCGEYCTSSHEMQEHIIRCRPTNFYFHADCNAPGVDKFCNDAFFHEATIPQTPSTKPVYPSSPRYAPAVTGRSTLAQRRRQRGPTSLAVDLDNMQKATANPLKEHKVCTRKQGKAKARVDAASDAKAAPLPASDSQLVDVGGGDGKDAAAKPTPKPTTRGARKRTKQVPESASPVKKAVPPSDAAPEGTSRKRKTAAQRDTNFRMSKRQRLESPPGSPALEVERDAKMLAKTRARAERRRKRSLTRNELV